MTPARRDLLLKSADAPDWMDIAPSQRNIIAAALAFGPATVKGIADQTGLSQYAVSKRLSELERMGLIRLTGREIDGCREWEKA